MILNRESAELIGIIIGDGNIYRKYSKYRIGFTGNIINDRLYFEYIKRLIESEWKKKARIFIGGRGLRIVINSKDFCNMLVDDIGLPYGKGKGEKVKIPQKIFEDWNLAKHTLRGIVDTDGSVFVSKKPRIERYPCIEITTTSFELAKQIKYLLEEKSFRVNKIRKSLSKLSKLDTYRIALNGQTNLKLWIEEIGFSNPYKLGRAISYLK